MEDSIKKSKIYTKTGDSGTTSLYNGERRPKDDDLIEALGSADELNSFLGLAREYCTEGKNGLEVYLEEIQSRLLDVGSAIATPVNNSPEHLVAKTRFNGVHVATIETWIDQLDSQLPPLKNFILPSGGRSSSALHVCRSQCRRAERRIVPLVRKGSVDNIVLMYLNRLSDFLFVAARYAAMKEGRVETVWRPAPTLPAANTSAS